MNKKKKKKEKWIGEKTKHDYKQQSALTHNDLFLYQQ